MNKDNNMQFRRSDWPAQGSVRAWAFPYGDSFVGGRYYPYKAPYKPVQGVPK